MTWGYQSDNPRQCRAEVDGALSSTDRQLELPLRAFWPSRQIGLRLGLLLGRPTLREEALETLLSCAHRCALRLFRLALAQPYARGRHRCAPCSTAVAHGTQRRAPMA